MDVFERVEKKYLLSCETYTRLMHCLEGKLRLGEFPETEIFSLYYDTDSYELIRRSVEKPLYKEKLRVRCYGVPKKDTPVYLELKKKYDGVVYKRRSHTDFGSYREKGLLCSLHNPRVEQEIRAFMEQYPGLKPKILIAVNRTSYEAIDDPALRLTFDTHMRYRTEDPDFRSGSEGKPILPDDQVIMEVKFNGAMPLWFARLLDACEIRPHSFSKVGYVYLNYILGGK